MGSSSNDIVVVPCDCDSAALPDLVAMLKARVLSATADHPLALDLTPGRPTALAVQLVASATRSLRHKAAFAGHGATAAPIFASVTDRQEIQ